MMDLYETLNKPGQLNPDTMENFMNIPEFMNTQHWAWIRLQNIAHGYRRTTQNCSDKWNTPMSQSRFLPASCFESAGVAEDLPVG
ncbi:hypothetical protein GRJ2_001455100 [Grus japonensis]|uniref:Uncharacterized protein n=1 Tax=Grus japonensis TaxID=30415 RepID=A0ABC9WWS8_GRUJA